MGRSTRSVLTWQGTSGTIERFNLRHPGPASVSNNNSYAKNSLPTLMLGAIGVVFGDIGTSPLYAIKETFSGHYPMPTTEANLFGVLSLVFWTIMMLVSIKYVAIIMRADNHGEGGSLALLARVTEVVRGSHFESWIPLLGIFAAALFYGDSMITPAISVLSAVEGLEVVAPSLHEFIVPITVIVLTGLFWIQRRGTAAVGKLFGPITCLWFLSLGVLGAMSIWQSPQILAALSPHYALDFFLAHPRISFLALGAVVLAVTGAEALYAAMGHFGRLPIRLAWFGFVLPALLLNYFGQGALLLRDPEALRNPFYLLAPDWALVPLLILATCATVIASQAVISGAYSVATQAVQMGYLPRMAVVQTSAHERGQVYVPFTNWTLYLAVIALVIGFKSSSNLAAAYGIAVTGTMMIDTILVAFVIALSWRWSRWLWIPGVGALLLVDIAFFAANAVKIPQGGWFPLLIGLVSFTVLTTWKRGRILLAEELAKGGMPLEDFVNAVGEGVPRVAGTAVFLTANAANAPGSLLHNLKHNQILHDRNVVLNVSTAETPFVDAADRLRLEVLPHGFFRLYLRYGFMEHPDIPEALTACGAQGLDFDLMTTSFFLSRETVVPALKRGMALWRERLFAWMTRTATSATDFFRIPPNRVVELGTQIEI